MNSQLHVPSYRRRCDPVQLHLWRVCVGFRSIVCSTHEIYCIHLVICGSETGRGACWQRRKLVCLHPTFLHDDSTTGKDLTSDARVLNFANRALAASRSETSALFAVSTCETASNADRQDVHSPRPLFSMSHHLSSAASNASPAAQRPSRLSICTIARRSPSTPRPPPCAYCPPFASSSPSQNHGFFILLLPFTCFLRLLMFDPNVRHVRLRSE